MSISLENKILFVFESQFYVIDIIKVNRGMINRKIVNELLILLNELLFVIMLSTPPQTGKTMLAKYLFSVL